MANIQYGSTSGKVPVKQNLLKDLGNSWLNATLSPLEGITGKNFFNPEMTTGLGRTLKGAGDITGNVVGAVAPAALNIVAPGAGTALSAVGKGIGSALPGEQEIGANIGMGLSQLGNDPKIAGLVKDMFKYGGKIDINPANKGKLTATSKKTGKSFTELSHSKNPLTKKRAVFALNSRSWKHALGGYITGKEYDLPEEEVKSLIKSGYEIEYL